MATSRAGTGRQAGRRPARVSIDTLTAEGRFRGEPTDLHPRPALRPRWALTLLERVFERLAPRSARGPPASPSSASAVVLDRRPPLRTVTIAAELGMSVAAVESAVRRLRVRYRDQLREEIAATLDDPTDADVAAEIRRPLVA